MTFSFDSESETLNTEISRPSPIPSLQPRDSEFRVRYERLGKFWIVPFLLGNKILCNYSVLMRIRQPHRRGFVLLWLTLSAPPANTGVEFGYK